MKISKHYVVGLLSILFFVACEVEETPIETKPVSFPEKLTVDIPDAISSGETNGLNGRVAGDGDGIIEGNEIYEAVPAFIHLGEGGAEILKSVLLFGKILEGFKLSEYPFVSEDDSRNKLIKINHDVVKGGKSYQYEMLMYDVDDDVLALQLLWNIEPVVEGITVLHPYNLNREENENPNALISVEYSENNANYEATMLVSISGLEIVNNGDIDNIILFAGKNGDIVDVMGNSNHPDVVIIDPDGAIDRNYAFVGRGDDAKNIGVINLALPPSNVTTEEVFADYNVKQVLTDEIEAVVPGFFTADQIDQILLNANSPAYFNETKGFIDSGETNVPSGFSSDFVNLEGMYPFVPKTVRDLQVDFVRQ